MNVRDFFGGQVSSISATDDAMNVAQRAIKAVYEGAAAADQRADHTQQEIDRLRKSGEANMTKLRVLLGWKTLTRLTKGLESLKEENRGQQEYIRRLEARINTATSALTGKSEAVRGATSHAHIPHGIYRGGPRNPRGSIWTNKDGIISSIPSRPDAEKEQKGKRIRDVCPTASQEDGDRERIRKDNASDKQRWVCHCPH